MRAPLPVVAVAVGVLGFSEPAAACGGCFDLGLQVWWWGAPALGVLAGLLLAEVLISALVLRVMGHKPQVRRVRSTIFALVLGFAASMLVGGSAMALALGMLLVLVPTFVRSLVREMPGAPRAVLVRVLGVVVALAASSVGFLPSQRETSSLIRLAVSVTARPATDGWIYDELRSRADADARMDALLGPDARFGDTLRVLRLHERLMPPAHHADICARLIAQTPEEQRAPFESACASTR